MATTYTTVAGDRWDHISNLAYGDPDRYDRIIYANTQLSVADKTAPSLPAGLVLTIPDASPSVQASAGLPPWKRSDG